MEEIRVIDIKQRLFNSAHIDPSCDHLLQNSAVSQVSLKERTDDHSVLMDDLLVDSALLVSLHFDGLISGIRIHVAQGHRADIEEAHRGFTCEEVCHFLVVSGHISRGDHAFFYGYRPDRARAGDVAGSVNIGIAGLAGLIIDKTETAQFKAAVRQELHVGAYARCDYKEVAGDHSAVAEDDFRDLVFVIDRHFINTDAIVLLNSVRRKCVDIGLCRFLIELLIEKPAGEVAQDDLDAQFQKSRRAVDADKT